MKKFSFLPVVLLLLMLLPHTYADNTDIEINPPKVTIRFTNAETGSGNAYQGNVTKIRAVALYEGCLSESEYTLVMRIEDAASGEPCMFYGGQDTLRETFTAEADAGIFEFEFEIDPSLYPGRTLIETHSFENMESYAVSTNEDSGRIYVPAYTVDAVSESGSRTVLAGKNTVICGVLSYYGFAPGEEYVITVRLKDRLTGGYLKDEDGNVITSEAKFTPSESDGQIGAKVVADLSDCADRYIAVDGRISYVPGNGISYILNPAGDDGTGRAAVYAKPASVLVFDEASNEPIRGVSVNAMAVADGTSFDCVSDAEGTCTFPLDARKRNICSVTSVPDEYAVPEEILEFIPDESSDGSVLKIYLLKKNTIVLRRTDADTGLPISGVSTDIYTSDGTFLDTVISNEEGKAYFDAESYWEKASESAIKAGKNNFILNLTFRDSSAPSEYYPREQEWTVSIDENRTITGNAELFSYKRSPVTIRVSDWLGNGITDVELSVYDSEGSILGKAITDSEGKVYFTPEKTGKYKVVESRTSSNYSYFPGVISFTIKDNGELSGTTTIRKLSNDITSSVLAVVILTAVFLLGWFSAKYRFNKAVRKRMTAIEDKNSGKHTRLLK